MRICADPQDANYWRRRFRACPVILLNGAPIRRVIVADEEAGFVEIAAFEAGRLLTDEPGERIKTERRHGRVEIISPQS